MKNLTVISQKTRMGLDQKQYKGKEYAVPAGQEAGRWVKMSEAERNKVYQTHREALGGDFSTDRDKLSKSVLDPVAAPSIPYALEATGKTVSRTLLAAIEKSGLSVDKRGLMMLMLDHLQNGEENQGTGEVNNSGKKNIDRVYASDTTSVYLDSATNRWKLKVVDKNGKARLDGFILPEKGAEDTEPKPAPEPVEEPEEQFTVAPEPQPEAEPAVEPEPAEESEEQFTVAPEPQPEPAVEPDPQLTTNPEPQEVEQRDTDTNQVDTDDTGLTDTDSTPEPEPTVEPVNPSTPEPATPEPTEEPEEATDQVDSDTDNTDQMDADVGTTEIEMDSELNADSTEPTEETPEQSIDSGFSVVPKPTVPSPILEDTDLPEEPHVETTTDDTDKAPVNPSVDTEELSSKELINVQDRWNDYLLRSNRQYRIKNMMVNTVDTDSMNEAFPHEKTLRVLDQVYTQLKETGTALPDPIILPSLIADVEGEYSESHFEEIDGERYIVMHPSDNEAELVARILSEVGTSATPEAPNPIEEPTPNPDVNPNLESTNVPVESLESLNSSIQELTKRNPDNRFDSIFDNINEWQAESGKEAAPFYLSGDYIYFAKPYFDQSVSTLLLPKDGPSIVELLNRKWRRLKGIDE